MSRCAYVINMYHFYIALMQLRKVCNHPDLFAERPVSSPFGVRGVEVFGHGGLSSKEDGGFARKAAVIQRLLHGDHDASLKDERFRFLESMGLVFIPRVGRNDRASQSPVADVSVAFATNLRKLRHTATELEHALATDGSDSSTPSDIFTAIRHDVLRLRLRHVREELSRWHRLQRQASISTARLALSACSLLDTDVYRRIKNNVECNSVTPFNVLSIARDPRRYHDYPACMPGGLVQTWTTRYERDDDTRTLLERFVCIHEKAVSRLPQNMRLSQQPEQSQLSDLVAIPSTTTSDPAITDPLHVVHTRQQALFPDRWLLQYDCGKLQVLDTLLRHLDANGDRCLIFTQMTRMIDVLETFLNIHGHRYLRLDGQTKPEVRHQLTERFNSDKRILCFILSTRSGGVGLNLTGANTGILLSVCLKLHLSFVLAIVLVIFYDSDWNPAMGTPRMACHLPAYLTHSLTHPSTIQTPKRKIVVTASARHATSIFTG